ncbi:MAG: glycosyltransferase family 1 protein [Calditrichia bacterium]
MNFIGKLDVIPALPDKLARLNDLAYNFYFSWHKEVQDVFRSMDEALWREVNHNPVMFLRKISQKKLEAFANDEKFIQKLNVVVEEFDIYIQSERTWFQRTYPEYRDKKIAYFSAEFGVHESLPIYSGGLGVLAGDHCKSASDLGIPLVGVGLAYYQAYFTQQINAEGKQEAVYTNYDFNTLPLTLEKDKKGNPVTISVELAGRDVYAQIWRAQVGRVPIYLLDANIEQNTPEDRVLTSRLYGGDQEMRISQEILLGIGGVRAIRALGIKPDAWHMNEGHSVFLGLSRIREIVREEGLQFDEALEAVAANNIFTTHTPVPAGHDAFPLTLKDKYFKQYWESVKIKRSEFMELGLEVQPEGYQIFSLTILAFNLSRFANGVSKLHGRVSRELWKNFWPDLPVEEVPIGHVTNGIHTLSWAGREMAELFDKYLGQNWKEKLTYHDFWDAVNDIPNEKLWQVKRALKVKMIKHLSRRLKEQYERNGMGILQTKKVQNMLNPDALIIGFARRFATYKRATLLFKDKTRLAKLLNDPERPVQIVFAGKAHPKDKEGQNLIEEIWRISQEEPFKGKIILVEGYDINMGRHLVAGTDVWLNNPRRPHEASGTSGQKVPVNGGINLSVLDGWWVEGYNGKNGWAFGDGEIHDNQDLHDTLDSIELYELLEQEVIPTYFDRNDDGIPEKWLAIAKESMRSVIAEFSTHRMLKDYVNKYYIPAIDNGKRISRNKYKLAKEIADWKEKIHRNWSDITIELANEQALPIQKALHFGEGFEVEAHVGLGKLSTDDVKVEIYLSRPNGKTVNRIETIEMKPGKEVKKGIIKYTATIMPHDSGRFKFGVRIIPYHKGLTQKFETRLIKWVEPKSTEAFEL